MKLMMKSLRGWLIPAWQEGVWISSVCRCIRARKWKTMLVSNMAVASTNATTLNAEIGLMICCYPLLLMTIVLSGLNTKCLLQDLLLWRCCFFSHIWFCIQWQNCKIINERTCTSFPFKVVNVKIMFSYNEIR